MSGEEVAWLAGLVDGEGSIVFMHKKRPSPVVRLMVTNTSLPLLEKIKQVTGVGSIIALPQREAHHAPCWNWYCNGGNAAGVLALLLPWLIVKRQRAEKALERYL